MPWRIAAAGLSPVIFVVSLPLKVIHANCFCAAHDVAKKTRTLPSSLTTTSVQSLSVRYLRYWPNHLILHFIACFSARTSAVAVVLPRGPVINPGPRLPKHLINPINRRVNLPCLTSRSNTSGRHAGSGLFTWQLLRTILWAIVTGEKWNPTWLSWKLLSAALACHKEGRGLCTIYCFGFCELIGKRAFSISEVNAVLQIPTSVTCRRPSSQIRVYRYFCPKLLVIKGTEKSHRSRNSKTFVEEKSSLLVIQTLTKTEYD